MAEPTFMQQFLVIYMLISMQYVSRRRATDGPGMTDGGRHLVCISGVSPVTGIWLALRRKIAKHYVASQYVTPLAMVHFRDTSPCVQLCATRPAISPFVALARRELASIYHDVDALI